MAGITLAGTGLTLEGREGETLTDTLFRAGYAMRVACQRGGCGLCWVRVLDGTVSYNARVAPSVLCEDDRAAGLTLACRAVPVSDVTVAVPHEARLRCVVPLVTQYALRAVAR